ncbi:terminase large subunit [Pediococcus inopinatus]|uniref:terminase large subunit n=1 Tax=Pediococcus inopinatus TaxID=114090 RepID=UPI002B258872|nr:terminase TerL endonuclease subunit [Pediococcus inopinatus]WPC19429.1 terminase large subunit [Pediococcus inopinatus]
MAGFDGEQGANVYFLANSQKQSSLLFEESKAMIDASPYLSDRFDATRSEIRFPKTNSKIVNMSAEKNNKDGENVHFAVFDEIHEYEDYALINVMKRSRGMRKQPLIVYITTAGYILDGPLMDFVENGQDCLNDLDDNTDERTFYFIAKLDRPEEMNDPEMWVKANPNFGLMGVPDMIQDFKKDRKNPSELADWVTKQFNIFSDIGEMSFLTMDTIKKNNKTFPIENLAGRDCVGGYDLSETEDFTSACLEFPLDDGSVFILEHTWIPQKRLDRAKNPERIKEWRDDGELTVVPGDYVKYEYVFDWFTNLSNKYQIVEIKFDRAKAFGLNKMLEEYGFETNYVIQGFTSLGGAMQDLKQLLLDGNVITNNSKIWSWYLSNIHLRKDRNDNWMPEKQSMSRKIDGFAAALDAHVRVMEMLSTTAQTGDIGFMPW